jgi:ribosomal protein L21E
MTAKEHEIVVLVHDLPDHRLQAGDVGTVVDVRGEGAEFEVEFVMGNGRTVGVITLEPTDIRKIDGAEILHVRRVG